MRKKGTDNGISDVRFEFLIALNCAEILDGNEEMQKARSNATNQKSKKGNEIGRD
jgi:hypothetical protein